MRFMVSLSHGPGRPSMRLRTLSFSHKCSTHGTHTVHTGSRETVGRHREAYTHLQREVREAYTTLYTPPGYVGRHSPVYTPPGYVGRLKLCIYTTRGIWEAKALYIHHPVY